MAGWRQCGEECNRVVERIAVGWGGLAAALGLLLGAGRDWPLRLLITGVAFAVGGMLAAVRAPARRLLTATWAWLAGWAIWAVFVILATLADDLGGPPEPELAPGTDGDTLVLAGWTLLLALMGATFAARRLAPRARSRR